ncbi:MAG: (2Fe-2S)-binding protein [Acidimicrobiales bacterium]
MIDATDDATGGDECAYSLSVNGRRLEVEGAWTGESLLYVLRNRLGLPGAKNACEQGECGSCSVLVDGELICSCLVLAATAIGQEIVTVEGLAQKAGNAPFTDVQQAFVDTGAVQCGFCTPGLVVTIHDLLDRNTDPTDLEVREAISGNLCRCTGYGRILEAIDVVRRARIAERAGGAGGASAVGAGQATS